MYPVCLWMERLSLGVTALNTESQSGPAATRQVDWQCLQGQAKDLPWESFTFHAVAFIKGKPEVQRHFKDHLKLGTYGSRNTPSWKF